ncbi:MAG: hypothetical protein NTX88_05480, partial [Candidatus Atribacteria bacterium]|nr:hypothetical protein [Candidatus Atribacteria bacterium]
MKKRFLFSITVLLLLLFAGILSAQEIPTRGLPSCCQPKSSGGGSMKIESYSKLAITEVIYQDGKIRVNGTTDLPFGSKLIVTLSQPGTSSAGIERKIEVHNEKFSAFLTPPDPSYLSQKIKVEVVFEPRNQPPEVSTVVGSFGEKISGDLVIVDG